MAHILLTLLLNYTVVIAAILIFVAPFYMVYRLRYKTPEKRLLSETFERFFESPEANALVFTWAVGEALVWFIIPEFLLLLMVFMRVQRKRELLIYDIAGTVAGTSIAYLLKFPSSFIEKLPFITPKMITQTESWYHQLGVFGLIHQPFSGVPFKVFIAVAAAHHYFLPAFILVAVLVRISRYYIAYAIFETAFPVLHPYVKRHYGRLFLVAVFIFTALLLRVVASFGPGYTVTDQNSGPVPSHFGSIKTSVVPARRY